MTLSDLSRKVQEAEGPPAMSGEVRDLALAVAEFEEALPGWWFSVGKCNVSADASCAVDVAGPDADLLTERVFDEGFRVDLPQPARMGDALRVVMKRAIAIRNLWREDKPQ